MKLPRSTAIAIEGPPTQSFRIPPRCVNSGRKSSHYKLGGRSELYTGELERLPRRLVLKDSATGPAARDCCCCCCCRTSDRARHGRPAAVGWPSGRHTRPLAAEGGTRRSAACVCIGRGLRAAAGNVPMVFEGARPPRCHWARRAQHHRRQPRGDAPGELRRCTTSSAGRTTSPIPDRRAWLPAGQATGQGHRLRPGQDVWQRAQGPEGPLGCVPPLPLPRPLPLPLRPVPGSLSSRTAAVSAAQADPQRRASRAGRRRCGCECPSAASTTGVPPRLGSPSPPGRIHCRRCRRCPHPAPPPIPPLPTAYRRFSRTYAALNLDTLASWLESGRLPGGRVVTMKDLRDSGAVGRQLGDGVKLLSRGAADLRAPVHLQARADAKTQLRPGGRGEGHGTCTARSKAAARGGALSRRRHWLHWCASCRRDAALPACPAGQRCVGVGASGCGERGRQCAHRVLQQARLARAAGARLVCAARAPAATASAPAAKAGGVL